MAELAHDPPTGIAGELPNWVWDVVMAIEKYEDEHPAVLQGRGPVQTYVSGSKESVDFGGWEWCIGNIYNLIPAEIRETASHIRRYRDRG